MKLLKRKKYLVLLAAVAAVIAIWLVWHGPKDYSPKTTSTAPTAQNNYSSGASRPSQSNNSSQGTAVDKQGGTVPNSSGGSSQPASSSSGAITLTQPSDGDTVKSGDGLAGTAQVPTVYYRLVDSTAGQVASGTLSVVNGKFSGILYFNSSGSNGKLDVYSLDSNGNETNKITLQIKFGG